MRNKEKCDATDALEKYWETMYKDVESRLSRLAIAIQKEGHIGQALEIEKTVQGEETTWKSEGESFEMALRDLRFALDEKTEENVSLKALIREKDIEIEHLHIGLQRVIERNENLLRPSSEKNKTFVDLKETFSHQRRNLDERIRELTTLSTQQQELHRALSEKTAILESELLHFLDKSSVSLLSEIDFQTTPYLGGRVVTSKNKTRTGGIYEQVCQYFQSNFNIFFEA
ncbi:MAG: hypothetical protein ABSA46_21600 [Thermodesulfovibrionales bacterium]|jgi:predicted RNase H-like nuclease (RuvC/YqgF family)